jgi:hypothetical protein
MPSVDREDQAAVVSLAASHHASDHRFDVTPSDEAATPKRGLKFWLVFLALGISGGVNMLELVSPVRIMSVFHEPQPTQSALSTALPTIIHELGGGTTFIWVGSAYALCATAFVPLSGNLAEVSPVTFCGVSWLSLSSGPWSTACHARITAPYGGW